MRNDCGYSKKYAVNDVAVPPTITIPLNGEGANFGRTKTTNKVSKHKNAAWVSGERSCRR